MPCLTGGPCTLCMILVAMLSTAVVALLYIVNGMEYEFLDIGSNSSLFQSSMQGVSQTYPLEITPHHYTYVAGWGLSTLWQIIWVFYGLTLVCTSHKEGQLFTDPPILPSQLYLVVFLASGCSVAWLVLWDRGFVQFALLPLSLVPLLHAVALLISYRRLAYYAGHLSKLGLSPHITLIRVLVHNGLAFAVAWGSAMTLLNVAVVLDKYAGFNDKGITSSIVLGTLGLEVLSWFVLETFMADRFVRHTVSPYMAWLWFLGGALFNNWRNSMPFPVSYTVLLGVTGLVLLLSLAKMCIVIYRHRRKPLFYCDHEAFNNFMSED